MNDAVGRTARDRTTKDDDTRSQDQANHGFPFHSPTPLMGSPCLFPDTAT
jgi:hypothetical protein